MSNVSCVELLFITMADRHGIRCNAILPGFTETPMTDNIPSDILTMVLLYVTYSPDISLLTCYPCTDHWHDSSRKSC